MLNYYNLLDIPKDATDSVIQSTLRRKTLRYYPRTREDDWKKDNFRITIEATEILGNKNVRKQYNLLFNKVILKKKDSLTIENEKLYIDNINAAINHGRQNAVEYISNKEYIDGLVWEEIKSSFGESLVSLLFIHNVAWAGAFVAGPVFVLGGLILSIKHYNDKFIIFGLLIILIGLFVIWYKVREIKKGE